jgi:hypothetical protein
MTEPVKRAKFHKLGWDVIKNPPAKILAKKIVILCFD